MTKLRLAMIAAVVMVALPANAQFNLPGYNSYERAERLERLESAQKADRFLNEVYRNKRPDEDVSKLTHSELVGICARTLSVEVCNR